MPKYKIYYLQKNRTETDVTITDNPTIAALYFKRLVTRGDLRHLHPMAVIERDGMEISSIDIAMHDAIAKIKLDPKEFPPTTARDILRAVKFMGGWKESEICDALTAFGYPISKSRFKACYSGETALEWDELGIIVEALCKAVKEK